MMILQPYLHSRDRLEAVLEKGTRLNHSDVRSYPRETEGTWLPLWAVSHLGASRGQHCPPHRTHHTGLEKRERALRSVTLRVPRLEGARRRRGLERE